MSDLDGATPLRLLEVPPRIGADSIKATALVAMCVGVTIPERT